MSERPPLIQRLLDDHGYPEVAEEGLESFLDGPEARVLFFAGDPKQFRETNDVAVILPELVKAFSGRLYPGLVAESAERPLQKRFGFRRWPALVFFRGGGYLGVISQVQNWSEYLEMTEALLAASPTEPPRFTIPVRSE